MDDYIKRELAETAIMNVADQAHPIHGLTLTEAKVAVHFIPAADVEPVRHGKWEDAGGGYVACSECGEEHSWIDYRAPYCENCGAKMDQEVDNAPTD